MKKNNASLEGSEIPSGNPSPGVPDRGEVRVAGRAVRDDILHIRICSDVKEAFFTLAARRGKFASELLLQLIEQALAEDA